MLYTNYYMEGKKNTQGPNVVGECSGPHFGQCSSAIWGRFRRRRLDLFHIAYFIDSSYNIYVTKHKSVLKKHKENLKKNTHLGPNDASGVAWARFRRHCPPCLVSRH
jgi:hypothetical protein